jgi:hypothetical protein
LALSGKSVTPGREVRSSAMRRALLPFRERTKPTDLSVRVVHTVTNLANLCAFREDRRAKCLICRCDLRPALRKPRRRSTHRISCCDAPRRRASGRPRAARGLPGGQNSRPWQPRRRERGPGRLVVVGAGSSPKRGAVPHSSNSAGIRPSTSGRGGASRSKSSGVMPTQSRPPCSLTRRHRLSPGLHSRKALQGQVSPTHDQFHHRAIPNTGAQAPGGEPNRCRSPAVR